MPSSRLATGMDNWRIVHWKSEGKIRYSPMGVNSDAALSGVCMTFKADCPHTGHKKMQKGL